MDPNLLQWLTLIGVPVLIFGATALAYYWAEGAKLSDQAWRVGLVTFFVAVSIAICWNGGWLPPLGIDLSGGTVMIYEIDIDRTTRMLQADTHQQGQGSVEDRLANVSQELVNGLKRRLDPGGINEISVRKYGDRQVEIIIPKASNPDELRRIQDIITKAGYLEFRIVADNAVPQHRSIIREALTQTRTRTTGQDPHLVLGPPDNEGKPKQLAKWVLVAREEAKTPQERTPFKQDPSGYILRDGNTGRPVDLNDPAFSDVQVALASQRDQKGRARVIERVLREKHNIVELEALVLFDDFNVVGSDLESASFGRSQDFSPKIDFVMTSSGRIKFGRLTDFNKPQDGVHRKLGILVDEQLLSAPNINSAIYGNGEITGNFEKEEVEVLVSVLKAGRLPAVLNDVPISVENISPLLGQDTIEKGSVATIVSLVVVLVFMAAYYNFAGTVAGFAVLLNLLFTIAIMILVKARLTMPGMAGLVLTVGMAVDANVLIYERMREELTAGSSFRMAIRNGFARAMSSIIDANLTTIITAVVLYIIGTDTIRGFAVTLILGIITSMFTAIFCARLVFDIWEKKGWATTLGFHQFFAKTSIDFVALRNVCVTASAVLCIASVAVSISRGRDMLDIDLAGGTTVQALFKAETPPDEVRRIVNSHPRWQNASVTSLQIGALTNRVYKIDVPVTGEEDYWEKKTLDKQPTEKEIYEAILKDQLIKGPDKDDRLPSGTEIVELVLKNKLFPGKLQTRSVQASGLTEVAVAIPAVSPKPSPVIPGISPAIPPETKPETAPEAKPEVKPEVKPDAKPETAPEKKPETSPEPKAAEKKTDETKSDEKKEEKAMMVHAPRGDRESLSFVLFQDGQPPETKAEEKKEDEKKEEVKKADEKKEEEKKSEEKKPEEKKSEEKKEVEKKNEEKKTEEKKSEPTAPMDPLSTAPPMSPVVPAAPLASTTAILTFGGDIADEKIREAMAKTTEDAIVLEVRKAIRDAGLGNVFDVKVEHPESSKILVGTKWKVTVPLAKADAEKAFQKLAENLSSQPMFPSSSRIGGVVAGNTQTLAISALIVSCFGIIAYVWFRFHKVVWGVAAVIALVHDVVISLGALAISVWLSDALGWAMVEDFKISLAVVAALLTIIGYSINDTIVIFDRIREIRGKLPHLTPQMINDAVNQTLSRSILTSLTVFLVVIILYIWGGPAIHAFAFTMVIGVFTGSYSTIYIAAPILIWFEEIEPEADDVPPTSAKKQLTA